MNTQETRPLFVSSTQGWNWIHIARRRLTDVPPPEGVRRASIPEQVG